MRQFKIDHHVGLTNYPFGLFVSRMTWYNSLVWEELNYYATRQEALDFYEKIKDLPEYLGESK